MDFQWRDNFVPQAAQDWLQEKFWPAVDGNGFGYWAAALAVGCWFEAGVMLLVLIGGGR